MAAKNRKKYNIVTLSASQLIKKYSRKRNPVTGAAYVCYEFDFTDIRARRAVTKSTDLFDDTALFYQIKEVLREQEIPTQKGEDSIAETLLFVDFEQLFSRMPESDARVLTDTYNEEGLDTVSGKINEEYLIKLLIEEGFAVRYTDDRVIEYVAFDKSNSMSRNSKMSFIDRRVAEHVSRRMDLDIYFDGMHMVLSKYYAYRGLYFTTADRVVSKELVLNAETVVVIEDVSQTIKGQQVVTAEQEGDCWNVVKKKKDVTIENVFDGEGIISPRYAELINRALGHGEASSFQVRMPFLKGMLHTVDFHGFIREFAGGEDGTAQESFVIRDAYGVERDLMKAEIVLPVSMLKCYKWLKHYVAAEQCMEYYFEKFHAFRHALYVGNTDLVYKNFGYTKLSYQFLNTLALTADEFDGLAKGHTHWAEYPVEYLEGMEYADNEEDYCEESWRYALRCNPVIAHEPGVKTRLEQLSNGLKLDLARGRLLVKGEVRFLSRDLLGFLIDLLKAGGVADKRIRDLQDKCLYSNKFFMPMNRIALEIAQDYPIFRSPHLSRNEQCAMKPYCVGKKKQRQDLYYRYFGGLKGILMVPYDSLVPYALSGADFDGDIVKIIDSPYIRNAVLRAVYDENGRRKLPLVVIPSPGGQEKRTGVPKQIPYQVVKNTFSNRIGQISNLSIRIGSAEYGQTESDVAHSCAECTILTGLEIDAAKTGNHPNLDSIMEYAKGLSVSFDYVHEFKELVDVISRERFFRNSKRVVQDGDTYCLEAKENGRTFCAEYVYSADLQGISRLPKHFFDVYMKTMQLPGVKEKNRYQYFDFLQDTNWKNGISPELRAKAAAVINAYRRVERLNNRVNRRHAYLEQNNFEGHVKTILMCQYDKDVYTDIVENDLCVLWAYVDEYFDTKQQAEDAIRHLEGKNWPFLLEHQKEQVLREVFRTEYDRMVKRLVTNFDFSGYNIMYYTLKDVAMMRALELTDTELLAEIKEELPEDVIAETGEYCFSENDAVGEVQNIDAFYEETFDELYEIFIRYREQKKSGIKKCLQEECVKRLNALLDAVPAEEKVKLLYSLRGNTNPDRNSVFFWKCVTVADLEAVMMDVCKENRVC